MKTAIVTGASRGLGLEIMVKLMEHNFTILRPPHSELDMGSEKSIAAFAERVLVNCPSGKIDVLINNAAVMSDVLNECLRVNAVGPISLTKHLWPLLRRDGGARVINISSREGLSSNNGWRPYSISKAALNGGTRMLSQNNDGVSVNACCPGWFRSNMGGEKAPISSTEAADTPVWMATEAPKELNGKFFINREVVPW